MITVALVTHLQADAALMAEIEGIHHQIIPQAAKTPAVTYELDDDVRDPQLDGQGTYRMAYMHIRAWAKRGKDAHSIAALIQSALIDYRGTFGTSTPAVTVDHIRLERGPTDLAYESDTKRRGVDMLFIIGYTQ